MLSLILFIVVVGVVLWAVNAYVPMEPNIKKLLNVVVIILLIVYLLNAFGVLAILDRPIVIR